MTADLDTHDGLRDHLAAPVDEGGHGIAAVHLELEPVENLRGEHATSHRVDDVTHDHEGRERP